MQSVIGNVDCVTTTSGVLTQEDENSSSASDIGRHAESSLAFDRLGNQDNEEDFGDSDGR